MKRHSSQLLNLAIVAGALAFRGGAEARTIDPSYQVGTWSEFRTAALSYTFDDNCSNQLIVAVPLFNEFNFTLTLFTVTSWVTTWQGLKGAASQGHEIASHTVTHVTLTGLSSSDLTNELKNSRDSINANITNQKCVTLAYPNCVEPNDAVTSLYYIAARGCSGVIEQKTPANLMNISSIVCGSTGIYTTAPSLNGLANQAINSGGWCVFLIHGIDNDGGYSPILSTVLRTHIQYVDSMKNVLWVSTFGNVVRYIRERDSVSVKETANSQNSITVQVTDNLDNSVYDYPLSVQRSLPASWSHLSVTQSGKPVPCSMVGQNAMFDVVPNGGDILLSNSATANASSIIQRRGTSSRFIASRFSDNGTVVSIQVQDSRNLRATIFDVAGRNLGTLIPVPLGPGVCQFALDKHIAASGICFMRLSDGTEFLAKSGSTDKCLLLDAIR